VRIEKMWRIAGLFLTLGLATQAPAHAGSHQEVWRQAMDRGHALESLTRTALPGGLAEYNAVVRVGSGEFDKIGLHRVVREVGPWLPARASKGLFFVHGSASTFNTVLLPGVVSSDFPATQGLAYFLAKAGIDVWGIDLRWTFVPLETTDFSFMRDWNIGTHVSDTRLAAKVARIVRGLTGSGFDRLFFSGHSLGTEIIYAFADADTQRPRAERDVKGLIPIEMSYKLTSPETQSLRDQAAVRYQIYKQLYDSGTYVFSNAAAIGVLQLALAAPDDPSPVLPGLTNRQTALFLLCDTYLTSQPPLAPYTPWYHYTAGTLDANGLPNGLRFGDADSLFRLGLSFPPYQLMSEGYEIDALLSDAVDSPYDDHLGEITVPVFYVGAAGGFGEPALETLSLLGSTDKTSLIVRLLPPGQEAFDYGHLDALFGSNAPDLVWKPILAWLRAH